MTSMNVLKNVHSELSNLPIQMNVELVNLITVVIVLLLIVVLLVLMKLIMMTVLVLHNVPCINGVTLLLGLVIGVMMNV